MRRFSPIRNKPAPKIVPAQVIHAVKPIVPLNFPAAGLFDGSGEVAFGALFTVSDTGEARVEMTDSTGHSALDSLALAAARHWRFRPATSDGVPVESYLRLRIEFTASSPLDAVWKVAGKEKPQ